MNGESAAADTPPWSQRPHPRRQHEHGSLKAPAYCLRRRRQDCEDPLADISWLIDLMVGLLLSAYSAVRAAMRRTTAGDQTAARLGRMPSEFSVEQIAR